MQRLIFFALLSAAGASAATLFMGTYHDTVIAFDEAKGQIVDTIPLTTGLPGAMRLSEDKKTLYVTTGDHSGIEVIDIATRKVTNHFVLNTPTTRIRFNASGVPDPSGKLFYTITTEMTKLADHYEIGKPKYTVIDLAAQKIAKTFDVSKEDELAISAGRGRSLLEISTDGKYLYHFGEKVLILSTDDFKAVDRMDLSKPELPGMEDIGFGGRAGQYRPARNARFAFQFLRSDRPQSRLRNRKVRSEYAPNDIRSNGPGAHRNDGSAGDPRQGQRVHRGFERRARKQALRILALRHEVGPDRRHPRVPLPQPV